jgi:hypothetical protein
VGAILKVIRVQEAKTYFAGSENTVITLTVRTPVEIGLS